MVPTTCTTCGCLHIWLPVPCQAAAASLVHGSTHLHVGLQRLGLYTLLHSMPADHELGSDVVQEHVEAAAHSAAQASAAEVAALQADAASKKKEKCLRDDAARQAGAPLALPRGAWTRSARMAPHLCTSPAHA